MTHLRVGNKVNWKDIKSGTTPVEVTIIGEGRESGELVYDLSNGHWAHESQLTVMTSDNGASHLLTTYRRLHDALDGNDIAEEISRLSDQVAQDYRDLTGVTVGVALGWSKV